MNSKKKPFMVDPSKRFISHIVCGPGSVLLAEGMITVSGDKVITPGDGNSAEQPTSGFQRIPFKRCVTIVEIDKDHVIFRDDNVGVVKLQPHHLANNVMNTRGCATCLTFSFLEDTKNDDKKEELKMNDKCITHRLQDGESFWDLDSNLLYFYSEKSNEVIPFTDGRLDNVASKVEPESVPFNDRYCPLGSLPTRYRLDQVLWYKNTVTGKPRRCYVTDIGFAAFEDPKKRMEYKITCPHQKDNEKIIYEVDNETFSQTPPNEEILKFKREHDIPEYYPGIIEASRVRKLFDEGIIEYSFNPSTFNPGKCYRIKTHQFSIDAILTNNVSSDGLTFGRFIRGERDLVKFIITPNQLVLEDIEIIKL